MVMTWLSDALQYELWLASDGSIPHDIYFSDLSWPIGKILYWKKTREVKQQLGITKLNAAEKEEEIYQKANAAYDALSTRLGDQIFLFDNSPTDVDALFLGHALFVLNVLPDTSVLRSCLQKYDNLVNFTKHLKVQLLEADSDSSATGLGSTDPSSSSTPRKRASSGRSKLLY
jgi:metaxin